MGAGASQLTAEQIQEIERRTFFTKKEIQRLYRRFQRLDRNERGGVALEDFQLIPELAVNPMLMRILQTMDDNNDGLLSFEDFISTLNIFHPKSDRMDKLAFAFRLYDRDNDGSVTRDELFWLLKTFVGSGFDDKQLRDIVDQLIADFDSDKSGELSFQEFTKIVTQQDLDDKMTIAF